MASILGRETGKFIVCFEKGLLFDFRKHFFFAVEGSGKKPRDRFRELRHQRIHIYTELRLEGFFSRYAAVLPQVICLDF